ncbi:MAG: flagellar hook-associated protein 3 FlgL [Solirubrobacteraceae bacterium]|nr:flagellar hook-associated protein 3 FlgL [Solirubrobacteraceae bacterium]
MSTRITNTMIQRSVLADLNDISATQAATRRKMSSGKEISRPSDDPYVAGRALALRSELEGIAQHKRNVGEALGWQGVTDTALGQIGDMAQRARELTLQGATDTLPQQGRDAIADEIDQLIAGIKQEANTTYDGRYVLGGSRTNLPPYDSAVLKTVPPGPYNDAYGGDSAIQQREIGPKVTLGVNVHGDEILGGAPGATGNMLAVLRSIAGHLRSGDTSALGTADLKDVQTEIENVLMVRARVGAGMNRLETAASRLAEIEESATRMLSNTEDADMAKTLVDFSTQQAVYQSALNAGARVVQVSLLDFLR